MDACSSDLLLHVIQYLSVRDSSRLSATSKRFWYLVCNYQRLRGPELVAVTSHIPGVRTRQREIRDVCAEAVQNQLQAAPNVAISFTKIMGNTPAAEQLPKYLPESTVILNVSSSSIQSSCNGELECSSRSALMLGSFPNVTCVPFMFGPDLNSRCVENLMEALEVHGDGFWKAAIVFCAGEFDMRGFEPFLENLQGNNPQAAIVGGICDGGHISTPTWFHQQYQDLDQLSNLPKSTLVDILKRLGEDTAPGGLDRKESLVEQVNKALNDKPYLLESVEDGVFGIVLGGEVPVRSIVSRGMRSLTYKGSPRPSTSLFVEKATYHRPGDEDYMFRGAPNSMLPAYHLISSIQDKSDGKLYSLHELFREFGEPGMLGLRRPDEDGFRLESLGPRHCILVEESSNKKRSSEEAAEVDTIVGMNIDLFELDGEECMKDMDIRMRQLKEITKNEKLLGAIMVSCSGRGPYAGSLIPERMSDASRFANVFPSVPCLGFYAGGEIGPKALAGRQSVFQTGEAALQGFTAVFAVFIVPKIDLSSIGLDDCPENVNTFVNERLCKMEE